MGWFLAGGRIGALNLLEVSFNVISNISNALTSHLEVLFSV